MKLQSVAQIWRSVIPCPERAVRFQRETTRRALRRAREFASNLERCHCVAHDSRRPPTGGWPKVAHPPESAVLFATHGAEAGGKHAEPVGIRSHLCRRERSDLRSGHLIPT